MIPISPKTRFGLDLIRHLQTLPELRPYVMDQLFNEADQVGRINALTNQYGGTLAVTPQMIMSDFNDTSIRDGSVKCDYGVLCFVHAHTWMSAGVDGVTCASDLVDALIGLVIPMIGYWQPTDVPYNNPVIVGEEDMSLADSSFSDTVIRGLRIRVSLYYPTIQ